MHVLVMGGTHHVGRAVVEAALRRGDTVTRRNRRLSRRLRVLDLVRSRCST
ncbi:hypothetical protein ABZW11_18420 [Nonomuraea sp. NPDC004580]|uniref:hypothetical protein n=1 Tax=Nonomuraea sp. NPDC004580 TaxID=3154552 RepID=UPI0033A1729C